MNIINTVYQSSLHVCCIFFAISDVIVTSVNTLFQDGISMWSNLCERIKNVEQNVCLKCFPISAGILKDWKLLSEQESQLPKSDCATCYVSKFVLFHELWELYRFQTAKVIFKGIGNGAIQQAT